MVVFVTLSRGNHPGEAQVKRGQRKKRNSLDGPYEIERKALRQRKNLAFSEDTYLENSVVEGNPKESWSGIEEERGVK